MVQIPEYLKAGDTIGLVCPAGHMAMEKVNRCIDTLQEWGFHIRIGRTVGSSSTTYFSGTDEERLADLQQMIDDKDVNAVLCARGGYGMGRIIDRLDLKKFNKKPKWIIGYSDITVLHCHLYANYQVASIHAPMAAAFNDEGYKNEFVGSLKQVLEGKKIEYTVAGHSFNKPGKAKGELVGGNLALLAHIVGTGSDIKTKNKILFIEDVGEYSYNIDRMLHQLKRSGKFAKLAGLVVGGFSDMKDTERPFGKPVYEIIRDLIMEYDFPVCFDFPVSHTDRNYALKIGVKYKFDVGTEQIKLYEVIP